MNYDIIGDIHGQADKRVDLLGKMGHVKRQEVWHHHSRLAIFLSIFIRPRQFRMSKDCGNPCKELPITL